MSTPKAAAYLFAGALILRLAYIYEIADNPFFTSPVVEDALRRFVESTDAMPYLPGEASNPTATPQGTPRR